MIGDFTFRDALSLAIGALSAYWGAHVAIKVEIARLDERLRALKDRVDSDHARLDKSLGRG